MIFKKINLVHIRNRKKCDFCMTIRLTVGISLSDAFITQGLIRDNTLIPKRTIVSFDQFVRNN